MFIKFMNRNLKGLRFQVFIAVVLTFVAVISEIMLALPLKFIPDKIQFPTGHNPPSFLDGILSFFDGFDKAHTAAVGDHTVLGVILFSAAMLIVFAILDALLGYIQLFLAAFIAQNLTAKLRKQLFEHLQRLSLDWHGKQKKGDLVQRVTGNISDIEKFVTDGLIDLVSSILTILGVAGFMLLTNVPYSLLSLVAIPPLAIVVFSYTSSIKAAAKQASKAAGAVADVATEDVGAITVLKAFSLENREADRFNKYVNKNREAALRAGGLQAQFTPLVAVLTGVATAIIIGVGAFVAAGNTFSFLITIPGGSIGIGTVILFITLLGKFFQPMKDLSKLINVLSGATAGAERIQEVLDQAPEVADSASTYKGPNRLRGEITFEDAFFGYTPEKLILKGITLRIPAGRKVALVGLSGGGKTTLIKLIPRFYEVTQGAVKVDGVDTRAYPLSLLRQNVSMVLQESVLFEGTVLENLKIGRPEAIMDEVIDAAKQAQIHDTIMSWTDGYGTLVRNQGKNFSGGQRQRMAIARAILSKAPILVLDEPTASLDVEAEAEVMRALDKLVVGRTVLMISHRLSTLGSVDEIIVLKDGRIAEQGSYQDLKRSNGVFAGLLKEQNRYNVDYKGGSMIVPKAELNRLLEEQRRGPVRPQGQPQPQGNWPVGPVPTSPRPPSGPVSGYIPPMPAAPPVSPMPVPTFSVPPTPYRDPYVQNVGQQRPSPVGLGNGTVTSQQARLLIELDGNIIGERLLDPGKPLLTVGRLSGNDVQVKTDRVSRLHARLHLENGTWVIEDAESLNGITIQGSRVDRHTLVNGDRIALAPKVALVYRTT